MRNYGKRHKRAKILLCLLTDIGKKWLDIYKLCTCLFFFRNPYPRPVNLPKKSFSKLEGKKTGKAIERLNQQSVPIYYKSISEQQKQGNTEKS